MYVRRDGEGIECRPVTGVEVDSLERAPIELVLPGDSRYMRLARLMASGVATAIGLGLDAVEDVRTAVDEVCSTLIEVADGQPIRLVFAVSPKTLTVTGETETDGTSRQPDDDRLALSHQILQVVTDSHEFTRSNGSATFRIAIPLNDLNV